MESSQNRRPDPSRKDRPTSRSCRYRLPAVKPLVLDGSPGLLMLHPDDCLEPQESGQPSPA